MLFYCLMCVFHVFECVLHVFECPADHIWACLNVSVCNWMFRIKCLVGPKPASSLMYLCISFSICVLYVSFMCVKGCLVLNVFCPELKALRPMFNHMSDYVICSRTPCLCFNHGLTSDGVNPGWSWGGEGTPRAPLGEGGGRMLLWVPGTPVPM